MKFPIYPATLIVQPPARDIFLIGDIEIQQEDTTGNGAPWVVVVKAMYDERSYPVELWQEIAPGIIEGLIWNPEGDGHVSFKIRETLPRDAEVALSMEGRGLSIPMPVELLAYIHRTDGEFSMPELFALTDDEGFVATMLLSAPTGLYVRYSSVWHPVTDSTVIENLNVYEVEDTALDLFDAKEREGQLPAVTSMLEPGGNRTGIAVEMGGGAPDPVQAAVEAPQERVVTASGGVVTVPALRGTDDLPAAIAAAADNPEIQWWVERRLAALGIEADLPWS